jgi:hypothetical protein
MLTIIFYWFLFVLLFLDLQQPSLSLYFLLNEGGLHLFEVLTAPELRVLADIGEVDHSHVLQLLLVHGQIVYIVISHC